jgi:hypothetical protein
MAIVAVLAVAAGLMLGLFALALIAGLALLFGLVLWVRGWLIGRKNPAPDRGQTLEAEYTVISTRSDPEE